MKYTAQVWDGETLIREVRGLDVVAADEIASKAPARGYSGRRMPQSGTKATALLWRCWFPDGVILTGAFKETVRVVDRRKVAPVLGGTVAAG